MKHNIILLVFFCCIMFSNCNTAPEKYFDAAVLNTNSLVGFAEEGQLRELAYPSAKLEKDGSTATMSRKEMVQQKIGSLEEDLSEIKKLNETVETKEMIKTSLELYEYVLPVYKTEYIQLAKVYDDAGSKETIASETKRIHDKYYPRYNELYEKLISIGKVYAEKHSIKVNWNVGA